MRAATWLGFRHLAGRDDLRLELDGKVHRIGNDYLPGVPYYYTSGTPYNEGDGIAMAMSVGADLWHMNNYAGPSFAFGRSASVVTPASFHGSLAAVTRLPAVSMNMLSESCRRSRRGLRFPLVRIRRPWNSLGLGASEQPRLGCTTHILGVVDQVDEVVEIDDQVDLALTGSDLSTIDGMPLGAPIYHSSDAATMATGRGDLGAFFALA